MAPKPFLHVIKRIRTRRKIDLLDITDDVQQFVTKSRVRHGRIFVDIMHTTAAACLQENEPGLVADIRRFNHIAKAVIIAEESLHDKTHIRGSENAAAHVLAMIYGQHIGLPIINGAIVLGTYQKIFFLEFDGPRPRPSDGKENFPSRQYTITIFSG